jgi:hypothetical protein
MEPDHLLANMRHLHSDVVQDTLKAVDRLNEVSKVVIESAKQVEKLQADLFRQRESMLIKRINELTETVKELTPKPDGGNAVAASQLTNTLGELAHHAKTLSNSSSVAWEFMKSTEGNQAKVANSMYWFARAGVAFGVLLFCAGVTVGHLWR